MSESQPKGKHGTDGAASDSDSERVSDEPVAGEHVKVGEVNFWVTRIGAGPPLLFLHGLPTTSFLWRNIQRLLADDFDCLAPDLVGCGGTRAPANTSLRLADQADLLPGLLDALELENVTVVAHDIGGAVAQYLAHRHPERVRALVLMDVVAHARYWPVALVKWMRVPLLGASVLLTPRPILKLILRSRIRKGLFQKARLTPTAFQQYTQRILEGDGPRELLRFVRGFDPVGLQTTVEQLSEETTPRMILWADNDAYQPLKAGQQLFDGSASGKFVHISRAGHFLQEDQPVRVADELRKYLQALPPPY